MGKKVLLSQFMATFVSTLITIIVGLLIGLLMLVLTAHDVAFPAFKMIITGSFGLTGFSNGFGRVLYYAVPIMMTGLSVGFALKTGVFNIGATGQFLLGIYAGIYVGIIGEQIFGSFTWIAALIAGAAAGGLWGLIQGLLQAYKNVNAIVCGIMMNYVGLFLMDILIKGNNKLYFGGRNWTNSIPANGLLPKAGLNQIFVGSGANSGIIFGIIICIVAYYILKKTSLGYEMKACGYNPSAARYAGINVERSVIIAMLLAGVFAGLGGVMYHNGSVGQKFTLSDALRPEGFTGIPVALLASNHPIGIIFTSLFIAYLQVGGLGMQSYGLEPEVVSVITAIIIFFCSFNFLFKRMYMRLIQKLFEGK